MISVTEIWIYPVKGLAGVPAARAAVEPWGLAADRRWMVVDESGRFLTQRQCPAMATVQATYDGEDLLLAAADHGSCRVRIPERGEPALDVVVWNDSVSACLSEPAADAFLSAVFGRACRLVFMADPAVARPVDPVFADATDRVSFADGYPLLLASTASLANLNDRMASPVPMDRFRPNLVVDGALPWAEDGWRRMQIGDVLFEAVKPCARCAVTTVDQRTGERSPDNEPIRTLQGFRRDTRGQVIFGQNLLTRSEGVVRCGDPLTLLA